VVLPLPVQEQVAAGQPLLAEAGLLQHARGGLVLGDDGRLDAVQAELVERHADRELDRLRGDPAPAVLDVHAVAQVGVLERPARDPAQRDPPHELVAPVLPDAELEPLAQPSLTLSRCDLVALARDREVRRRSPRFVGAEVVAIAHDELEERLDVLGLGQPQLQVRCVVSHRSHSVTGSPRAPLRPLSARSRPGVDLVSTRTGPWRKSP
jgi:hypothetical protein